MTTAELHEFKLAYEDGWEEVWLARAGATPMSLVTTAKHMLDLAGATYDIKFPLSEPPSPISPETSSSKRPSDDGDSSSPASSSDDSPARSPEAAARKPSRSRAQTSRRPSKSNRRRGEKVDAGDPSVAPPGGTAA